jgi:hypothetical protein
VKFLEKITRRNSIGRLAIVSAVPFLLIATDFFFSPILIDTHIARFDTSLNDLFKYNSVYLGIFRGNDCLCLSTTSVTPNIWSTWRASQPL